MNKGWTWYDRFDAIHNFVYRFDAFFVCLLVRSFKPVIGSTIFPISYRFDDQCIFEIDKFIPETDSFDC